MLASILIIECHTVSEDNNDLPTLMKIGVKNTAQSYKHLCFILLALTHPYTIGSLSLPFHIIHVLNQQRHWNLVQGLHYIIEINLQNNSFNNI